MKSLKLRRLTVIMLALLLAFTGSLETIRAAEREDKGIKIAFGSNIYHLRLEKENGKNKIAYCYNNEYAVPDYYERKYKKISVQVTYSDGEEYNGQELTKRNPPASYEQIRSFLYAAYPIDGLGLIQKYSGNNAVLDAEMATQEVLWYLLGDRSIFSEMFEEVYAPRRTAEGIEIGKKEVDRYSTLSSFGKYVCDIFENGVLKTKPEDPGLTFRTKKDFNKADTLEFTYDTLNREFRTPELCLTGFNGEASLTLPEGITLFVNGVRSETGIINTSEDTFYFASAEVVAEQVQVSYIYAYTADNILYHNPTNPTHTLVNDDPEHNRKAYQNLISFDIKYLTGGISIAPVYKEAKLQVEITKSDEKTGEVLEGAKFELWGSDALGNPVNLNAAAIECNKKGVYLYEITVDAEYVARLLNGETFYVKEVRSPSGYILSDKQYPISLADNVDGETGRLQINVTNKQIEVTLIKHDADTNKTLSDAVFDLYRRTSGGPELIKEGLVTNEYGIIRVTGLSRGEYYFQETKAPDGYELKNETASFTVDSVNLTVHVTNQKKQELTALKIKKIDADTKEPLSGVVFDLYYLADGKEEKKVGTFTTDSNGEIEVEVALETLNNGTYYIKEVKTREDYILDSETKYYFLNGTVTVENKKYEKPISNYGQLIVTKQIISGSYEDEFTFRLTITRAIPKEELETVHSQNGVIVPSGGAVSGSVLSGPAIVYKGSYGLKQNNGYVITRNTDENGFFVLKAGEEAVFEGIEVGSSYTVEEILKDGSTYRLASSENANGFIQEVGAVAKFVNEQLPSESSKEPSNPPTEPIIPDEPMYSPAEPTVPDEPTNPPTEPVKPDEPTNSPAEPTVPDEPTNPPTEPVKPDESTNPPAEPTIPDEPVNPPAEPIIPDEPTNPPTEPVKPDEPNNPPTEPTVPDEPTSLPEIELPEEIIPEGEPTVPDEVRNTEGEPEETVDMEENEIPQGAPDVTEDSTEDGEEEIEIEEDEIPEGAPVLPQTGTVSSGVFYLAGLLIAAAGAVLLLDRDRKKTNH